VADKPNEQGVTWDMELQHLHGKIADLSLNFWQNVKFITELSMANLVLELLILASVNSFSRRTHQHRSTPRFNGLIVLWTRQIRQMSSEKQGNLNDNFCHRCGYTIHFWSSVNAKAPNHVSLDECKARMSVKIRSIFQILHLTNLLVTCGSYREPLKGIGCL
jgi:hypothetical protein